MSSNHLILCRPLLLLPSIFPSIRVFSRESPICTRWPKGDFNPYLIRAKMLREVKATCPRPHSKCGWGRTLPQVGITWLCLAPLAHCQHVATRGAPGLVFHKQGTILCQALFCIPRIQHRTEQNLAPALETWGGARKGEIARKVSSLLQGWTKAFSLWIKTSSVRSCQNSAWKPCKHRCPGSASAALFITVKTRNNLNTYREDEEVMALLYHALWVAIEKDGGRVLCVDLEEDPDAGLGGKSRL